VKKSGGSDYRAAWCKGCGRKMITGGDKVNPQDNSGCCQHTDPKEVHEQHTWYYLLKNVSDTCRNKGQDFKIINRLCTGCKKPILPEADGGDSL
jgi:hypothetical protein